MRQDHNSDTHTHSMPDLLNVYWRGLEALSQGAEPLMKSAARCNLELLSLASRRARAYFDLPSAMGRCRSPQDLAGEQARFWQSAAQDYTDSARSIMSLWTSMLGAAAQIGNGVVAAERDFITFAEPREEPDTQPGRKSASRRAA